MSADTTPPPATPVGRWLDEHLSPRIRYAIAILLGMLATLALEKLIGEDNVPPIVIPLHKGEADPQPLDPPAAPAPIAPVVFAALADTGPAHRIPTGGGSPRNITLLAGPELAPEPRDNGPIYSVPPGELVPTVLEFGVRAERADWGHAAIGVADAWKRTRGKGVKVAVLDTGVDLTHPDLRDAVVASKDFTGSPNGVSDVQGHGSHCAGVVGARENATGVVGVAPECSLLIAKCLGDTGSGGEAGIAAAIDWAAGQGADVISMSLGSPSPSVKIRDAIHRAVAAGAVVVCAAGNDGPGTDTVGYPGGFADAIAVAAVGKEIKVADFSSRGPAVLVAAPGVDVVSCYPGSRLATMSGTSMATPYVAGCAALWVAANPGVPRADRQAKFKAAVQATAKDIPPSGRDVATGFGLVQPAKLAPADQPPPVPPSKSRPVLIDFEGMPPLWVDPATGSIVGALPWNLKPPPPGP